MYQAVLADLGLCYERLGGCPIDNLGSVFKQQPAVAVARADVCAPGCRHGWEGAWGNRTIP